MVVSERFAACAQRMRTLVVVLSLASGLGACASLGPDRAATAPFMPYTNAAPAAAPVSGPPAPAYAPAPRMAQAYPQSSYPTSHSGAGQYKVGAPYQSGGVWYVPAEQPNYDETGLASWYGDAFDGKPTANGEVFNMYGVSAAHATLPMPCMVEVTNLENGKTIQVRMNDRGPFHPGRIIDVSRGAADQLGFAMKGTAKVRVRYIGPASLDNLDAHPLLASSTPAQPAPEYLLSPNASPHRPAATRVVYQTVPPARRAAVQPASSEQRAEPAVGYAVQAGAYSSRLAAKRAASRLSEAGPATVVPMDRNGAVLYRVVVGSWPAQTSAEAARTRVTALGFADARIVPGA